MSIAGIAMTAGGGILILLGALARNGALTRQRIIGLRTEATLASDDAWQAAHAAAAVWIVVAGTVLLAGGVLVTYADSQTAEEVWALAATFAMLIPLGVAYQRGQAAAHCPR